jgi:hypothetical protein
MVVEQIGLQTSAMTWYLATALLVVWALSLPLFVGWRPGWRDVLLSLRGLAWCGFGFGIVLRFFLLAADAETFTSPSIHLPERSAYAVDLALVGALTYWVAFGAVAALAQLPLVRRRLHFELPRQVDRFPPAVLLPAAGIAAACTIAALSGALPAALVTPLGVLGSMWVIPATTACLQKFRGQPIAWWVVVATFVPAALAFVLNPYREQILLVMLVVLTAAVVAGRRVPLSIVMPAAVALALVSTIGVTSYRRVLWDNYSVDEEVMRVSASDWSDDDGPWLAILRRFHVLDSLLLTVDLVPDVYPYTDQPVVLDGITRALVPRLLMPDKDQSDQGQRFQALFWSYYDNPTREEATASIAPSMPGSLYEAGGLIAIASGALVWGLLLTLIDLAKHRLHSAMAVSLHLVCATPALAGVERDYVLASSALLQTLVIFIAICVVVRLFTSRAPAGVGAPVGAAS